MMKQPDTLSVLTKYTQNRMILVELFNQFCVAVLGFAAVIAIKTLNASEAEVVILTNGSQIVFLFAYILSAMMAGRSKKPFLIAAGLLTRLSLLACAFISDSLWFTIIVCITFLGSIIYIPAINALGQSNYRPEHRGRVTGNVTLWSLLTFVLVTLFIGSSLQRDPESYKWLFPCAGVAGFIAYYLAAHIRFRRKAALGTRRLSRSLHDLKCILKSNPTFLKFQLCFFIYGVAFMICMPTNILVITKELNMTYQEYSIGVMICGAMCIALLSPSTGRVFDRLGPTTSCAIFFCLLALHPACMYCALVFENIGLVYVSYVLFGIAMAGVNQSWLNGPMYYAGKEDSAVYMGIHMSNVGIRAILGSALVIIGNQAGTADGQSQLIPHETIYIASVILLLISAMCMYALKSPPSKRL